LSSAPVDERTVGEVPAVEMEQVENDIDQLISAAFVHDRL
jgi:hypothetical protein